MSVTAQAIMDLSERPCEEDGATVPDGMGLGWLAVAFPTGYPAEHPEAVECAATFGGGVAIDFDIDGHSYALDVNLQERVGVLERIYPTSGSLGEYDLADDANWRNIGAMMTSDAGGEVEDAGGISRHDSWRMLSDAIWSHHRMRLNGWDADEDNAEAVREWLRIAAVSCGENYDHLYRGLGERYPNAAAMVADSAELQHILMDIKSEQRHEAMAEWLLESEATDPRHD